MITGNQRLIVEKKNKVSKPNFIILFLVCLGFLFPNAFVRALGQPDHKAPSMVPSSHSVLTFQVYLPLLSKPQAFTPRVNIPFFSPDHPFKFEETSLLWFGKVTPTENYTDVRIAYSADELWVYLATFDRRLWYDVSPSPTDLASWDAASMYLNLDGNVGDIPNRNTYRFVGQLVWWEAREKYQAVYQGTGSGWELITLPFITTSGWAGYPQPNDDLDDRGWIIAFRIPFSSLGLTGPPSQHDVWGLGFSLHDRDDEIGTQIKDKKWPIKMDANRPVTWGQLSFGLPEYTPPSGLSLSETVTIRHKLNGSTVVDGMVGGSSICGEGLDYWTEWGEKNYAGAEQVNVQNEIDISDWPCFSKFYITFPLHLIPPGKEIISATLTLHSIGNAGGGQWGESPNSLVQVFLVGDGWNEDTLAWNNAPMAKENVSRNWVEPISDWPGWPGIPENWDVSYAVNKAYHAGEPLRLALYSADREYNSGRYFSSSDYGDWNEIGRPTLEVVFGNR